LLISRSSEQVLRDGKHLCLVHEIRTKKGVH